MKETKESLELEKLSEEQKKLEQQISKNKKRISDIRLLLQGSGKTLGLSAIVETQRRKQAWIDAEPDREAFRATPEWKEWHAEFIKRGKNV